MDRYRPPSNPPHDDPSLNDGDISLIGVNSFDSAENLSPGQAQAATNIDFTTQDAVTRGGFVCISNLGPAPFGQTWTSRTPATASNWKSVAFNGTLFAAVSNSANVMTSPDGVTWTARTGIGGFSWSDVCWGNNLFVACSSTGTANGIMTSPDGVTWTQQTAPARNSFAVCYGPAGYIVTGSGQNAMTSPDGITWTAQTIGPSVFSVRSIVYGNGTYVALDLLGSILTTPDGVTWTDVTPTVPAIPVVTDIVYGAGLFVVLGGSGSVFTSPDTINWTQRVAANSNTWFALAYGDGGFVAVAQTGSGPRVMSSIDGISWLNRTAASSDAWNGVAFGNNVFVAVANDAVMSSNTGAQPIFANSIYSDPNDAGSQWIMMVGATELAFVANGRTTRTVQYDLNLVVTEQSTIVQCNNVVYIMRGADVIPLFWDGNWGSTVTTAPPMDPPISDFTNIANSNQATFYQNRLWVIDGKDNLPASDILDFTSYNELTEDFNMNTGSSDFLVTTYPFGSQTLVVFKNKSIYALLNVNGDLSTVISTEITRQVGAIGINAVVSVGTDLVYMSDRNINLISLTDTNNALQHQTQPLSRNIRSTLQRVNWQVASKVSMAYWDNKLFVALPLDNATSCNSVVVYNFITQQWFGEWSFDTSIGMAIQGWAVATYLGATRLHCVTEDGRIFVTNEGQNDISGTTVAEIACSLTTRAYPFQNDNRFTRRMIVDLSLNRCNFTLTSYVEGENEHTVELANQTYSRANSWLFGDTPYDLTNANNDYNRAFRQDYSTGPNNIQCGTGFRPEAMQVLRMPIITRRNGRLQWVKVDNTTGFIRINGVIVEARAGYRGNLTQVG